ncbi:SIR2 family protein [Clostridium butyricum]|uniref:SIR2 family protein n=1 Tax=Clostridium butyricum TaxID=1492 RepID=UPI0022E23645|nr:SIR2 family protein [Clostridium butyricum]
MAEIKYLNDESFQKIIIKLLESDNLNLLLGAGFSANVLRTLGTMERFMEIIQKEPHNNKYIRLEAVLYWNFFETSIFPMVTKLNDISVLKEQCEFLSLWQQILDIRDTVVLQKQLNIFTTNYDVILELAMENECIEYNDGFQGLIKPYFSTSNYNKIYYKQVLFSNRISLLPMFNLYKIHGSITWKSTDRDEKKLIYGNYISELQQFYDNQKEIIDDDGRELLKKVCSLKWDDINKDNIDSILKEFECTNENKYIDFTSTYKKSFKIVNPTKQKFSDTIVNKNYYELLRIYCNELERENTLLIAYGFSFYDEHIEDLTKRALNNPSLILIVFSYTDEDKKRFEEKFKFNNNVWIIGRKEWNENIESSEEDEDAELAIEATTDKNEEKITLKEVNEFLSMVIKERKENE